MGLAMELYNPVIYDVLTFVHISFKKDENSTAKEIEEKFIEHSNNYINEKYNSTKIKPYFQTITTDDTKIPFSELMGKYASEHEYDFVFVGCDKKEFKKD